MSHTSYIREPLLLSDISIARPAYWPGLDEGQNLICKHNIFCDFKSEFIDEKGFFNRNLIKSDFIVGYSLLRKDLCDWGEDYIKIADRNFLDKVLNGIVGMKFAHLFSLKNLSEKEIAEVNEEAKDSAFYDQIKERLNRNLDLEIAERKKRLKELLPQSLFAKVEEKIKTQNWANYKLFMSYKGYLLKRSIDSFL